MDLFSMKAAREAAINKAESFVKAAESASRQMTAEENSGFDSAMVEANALTPQIERIESLNTIRTAFPTGQVIPGAVAPEKAARKTFSKGYQAAFYEMLSSKGAKIGAALYEGSDAAGGFAVPVEIDGTIVPLAPAELAIRQLARVIPTTHTLKFPIKAAHGTAAAKLESTGTDNPFAGTAPTLAQVELDAYMAGDIIPVSWELLEDVAAMQSFIADDLTLAVQQYEEPLFVTGSGGTGVPQGVATGAAIGVTVTGASGVVGAVSLDAMDDLIGSLNPVYLPGAALLMKRSTGVLLRKLSRAANLFEARWSRSGNQEYYDGYPVSYSASVQSGATTLDRPVLFGDFKRGFVIGDRGGSAIRVKVLDQISANLGVTQFLAYRRTDSVVIRSEAIQALKVVAGA
jgi:HK97 family phage major capsid protein